MFLFRKEIKSKVWEICKLYHALSDRSYPPKMDYRKMKELERRCNELIKEIIGLLKEEGFIGAETVGLKVTIPAGIDNGQTISLRGQGNAGRNGGPAGDLLIVIAVRPHEIFRREGTSVLCEAPITFTQAVLGAELEIPTIDGKVKYTIPEGTQSGTTFRLKGKGIPGLNGRGRGDQYVTVYIETPRNLNREQKEALKKFSESLGEKNYEEHKSFFGKFKL